MRADESSTLGLRIADMGLRPLFTCPPDVSVGDAARRMASADAESIVTLDADGRPTGILTDRDLRRRVLASGIDPTTTIASVLSSPVITIPRSAAGYQAVAEMLERHIHHLVVVDERGRAVAQLADSDLLGLEAAGPIALARRIERAVSVEELTSARGSYHVTLRFLLDSGAGALTILAILAEANDRVQRRLLDLASSELGPAPLPFAWLVMGSEGRRTQTLRTDQDNGLVWADGADQGAHFDGLSRWMVDALERTGLPRCYGDVMATNELWRGPVAAWRERFERWLREPEPVALLRALVAFDFRAVGGDTALATDLRSWLVGRTPGARMLLIHVARAALRRTPPLAPLGWLRLARDGSFDAKLEAIGIVVDAARLLALELGLATTNTMERLTSAATAGVIPGEDAADAAAAYDALQLLRLRRQAALASAGEPPDNRIVPRVLGRAERAALREHLAAIARLQSGIADRYGEAARVS